MCLPSGWRTEGLGFRALALGFVLFISLVPCISFSYVHVCRQVGCCCGCVLSRSLYLSLCLSCLCAPYFSRFASIRCGVAGHFHFYQPLCVASFLSRDKATRGKGFSFAPQQRTYQGELLFVLFQFGYDLRVFEWGSFVAGLAHDLYHVHVYM